ncbi:hypothetical protein [Chitinimonas naiadis]
MKIKPHDSTTIVTRMDGPSEPSVQIANGVEKLVPQTLPDQPVVAEPELNAPAAVTTPFSPLVDNAASRAKAASAKSWGNRYLKGSYGNGVPHKAR